MNKRMRMRKRATRLLRGNKPFYFFLRSVADVLHKVNKCIIDIGKGLKSL